MKAASVVALLIYLITVTSSALASDGDVVHTSYLPITSTVIGVRSLGKYSGALSVIYTHSEGATTLDLLHTGETVDLATLNEWARMAPAKKIKKSVVEVCNGSTLFAVRYRVVYEVVR